ncbi:hypothetical protein WJ85_11540 [Burkholderia ubonensis]|nr:hypothetical protein WJ85_11540 [Burkholderia ubonensis]KWC01537.1 hypothetical protein WL44_28880 [Burkholderia ubonensis]
MFGGGAFEACDRTGYFTTIDCGSDVDCAVLRYAEAAVQSKHSISTVAEVVDDRESRCYRMGST